MNVPFVVSVEGLRGLPGARSAAVLAAYACQPHEDLTCVRAAGRGAVRGPAAESVERFTAARRLEGWSVWLQVFEAARLARYWDGHPFDADAPAGEDYGAYWNAVEAADPALYERLVAQINRVQARTPRDLDAVELTDDFVAAECSLASGLTRPAADGRALAARVLLIDGAFPRVTALLRAGFLDWSKLNQLVAHLLVLGPVLGPAVERALIPDTDLLVAESAPGPDGAGDVEPQLEVLADPARPGAQLPGITRMSVGAMLAAITAHATALDPDGAAERARDARVKRSVWTLKDPDGMARLEASAGHEDIAAVWNALTDAARTARRHGDTRTLDQLRLDALIHRTTGTPTDSTTGSATTAGSAGATTGQSAGATTSGSAGAATRGSAGVATEAAAATAAEASAEASGSSGASGGCVVGSGLTPDRRLTVNLTIPLSTYLNLAADPCALDSYGVIPAALARQIAADAVRDHPTTTTWRCILTDNQHRTVLGLTRPIRTPAAASASRPARQGPAREGPAREGPAREGPAREGPGQPVDPGPLSTPRHDPPPQLVELVRAALPRCVFPGCNLPARRCDLDHRIPYDHHHPDRAGGAGPTCSCNLQSLCRTHHRLKTTGLITVRPAEPTAIGGTGEGDQPGEGGGAGEGVGTGESGEGGEGGETTHAVIGTLGTLTWTSRAGLTYTSSPEPVTMPADPATADALREILHQRRHPDLDHLRAFYQELRETKAQGKIDDNLATLRRQPWRLETWTDTIDRPDPDQPLNRQHLDELDADDPYAQIPLPPLVES